MIRTLRKVVLLLASIFTLFGFSVSTPSAHPPKFVDAQKGNPLYLQLGGPSDIGSQDHQTIVSQHESHYSHSSHYSHYSSRY